MIIKKEDLKNLTDEALQNAEDAINEIQAERRAASPNPIDAEREAMISGFSKFMSKLKSCDSLDQMWK